MTLDLDELESKAKAAGGDQWGVEWFECKADSDDVRHAATKPLKNGEERKLLSVGDVLWRVPKEIGPISPDHNHWAGNYLACSEEEAEFAASADPATILALVAHIRKLAADKERYRDLAERNAERAAFLANDGHAVALIRRIRELEELIDEICEYRNTVARFEPDTQEKLDAYERVRTQTAAEQ
jgi:hypothetical protein